MSNSKNKSLREELERIYGKHCMVHEGIRKLRPPTPKKGNDKGKSIASQITLHHLVPLRKGGPTNLVNGSLVCRRCHDWLEQLPNVEREKVNNELREYKRQHGKELEVVLADSVEVPFEVNAVVFEPQGKVHGRAKVKADTRKAVDEYEKGERE